MKLNKIISVLRCKNIKLNLRYYILKLFLVVILTSTLISQQKNDSIKTNNTPIVADNFDYSFIPQKITQSAVLINQTLEELEKQPFAKKDLYKVKKLLVENRELKLITDSLNLSDIYPATLIEFNQKWEVQRKFVQNYLDGLVEPLKVLENQKKKLVAESEGWNATDSIFLNVSIPEDLAGKILEVRIKIDSILNILTNNIYELLSVTTQLSEDEIYISATFKRIETNLISKRKEIFVQNSPPIWQPSRYNLFNNDLHSQLNQIWTSQINSAEVFYKSNKKQLLTSLILFIILLVLMYKVKHQSRKIIDNLIPAKREIGIINHPISLSIVIFFFFLLFFYPDIPDLLLKGIKIILAIPILRLLLSLTTPKIKTTLKIFIGLLVLQQFNVISESGTNTARILLLIFLVAIITWLGVQSKRNKLKHLISEFKNKSIAKSIFNITIIILITSFLANLFGFSQLSSLLVNGLLNSIFAVLVVIVFVIIIESLLVIFLKSNLVLPFKSFKEQPEKVISVTSKYLRIAAIFFAFMILLKNFGISEIIQNWFFSSLKEPLGYGQFAFNIEKILLFIISIWLSVLTARIFKFFLQGDLLPRLNLARGVPGAISAISSYLIVGFGIIVAFTGTGIDLNNFTLIVSALGVGIGFGLQDLVRNFIAGLILIFERPIQIGDTVQIDELNGTVKHIGIRSSTVRTWEGAEVIVPNGNLISNKLINWTLSDKKRRIDIRIGVAYGTDVNLVMDSLLECVRAHQDVLDYPAPNILFSDFADSSLEFELRCWTSNSENWIKIKSEINLSIEKIFKENNIVIPFPQRDIHIKSDDRKS